MSSTISQTAGPIGSMTNKGSDRLRSTWRQSERSSLSPRKGSKAALKNYREPNYLRGSHRPRRKCYAQLNHSVGLAAVSSPCEHSTPIRLNVTHASHHRQVHLDLVDEGLEPAAADIGPAALVAGHVVGSHGDVTVQICGSLVRRYAECVYQVAPIDVTLPKQAELDEFEPPLDTPPKSSVICFHKAPAAMTVPKLGQSSY